MIKAILALAISIAALGFAVSTTSQAVSHDKNATAVIQAPLTFKGKDGFAALYTLGHEVPAEQQQAVLNEDVKRFNQKMSDTWAPRVNDFPKTKVPIHMTKGNGDLWCYGDSKDCLDQIRGNQAAYEATIRKYEDALVRAEALSEYDSFRSPFRAVSASPVPEYRALAVIPTRNALLFLNGETTQALTGVCSNARLGRRLMDGGDTLVGSMVGASLVRNSSKLLTEIMAELPDDYALPAICNETFATPVSTKNHVCRAIMGEGKQHMGTLLGPEMKEAAAREGGLFAYDAQATAERVAKQFTWYCSDNVLAQILQDKPVDQAAPVPSKWSLECVKNRVGCVIADMAIPKWQNYVMQIQDTDAIVKSTTLLINARNGGKEVNNDIFADIQRDIQVIDGAVNIPLHIDIRGRKVWSMSTPGSRLANKH